MLRIVRNGASVSLVLLAACAARTPTTPAAPPVTDPLVFSPAAPGIERAEATTRSVADAQPIRVWIYRPQGRVPARTWPCVLVAPGGTNGATGVAVDAVDAAEHLPYVRRGFAVVAFEVDGAIARGASVEAYRAATRAFVAADGGLASLRAALALAAAREPSIDADRAYVAGHGAGGALALRAAAAVPGVRGVVAYAPLLDPLAAVGADLVDALEPDAPGLRALLTARQPPAIAADIRVPAMLFHATDDARAPIEATRALAAALAAAGHAPLVVEVPAGGHVNALFAGGLEQGATWLEDRANRDAGKAGEGGDR